MKIPWISIIIIIVLIFIPISMLIILFDEYGLKSADELCTEQCNSFNYTFYKLETKFPIGINCWCYNKEGEPIFTGEYEK